MKKPYFLLSIVCALLSSQLSFASRSTEQTSIKEDLTGWVTRFNTSSSGESLQLVHSPSITQRKFNISNAANQLKAVATQGAFSSKIEIRDNDGILIASIERKQDKNGLKFIVLDRGSEPRYVGKWNNAQDVIRFYDAKKLAFKLKRKTTYEDDTSIHNWVTSFYLTTDSFTDLVSSTLAAFLTQENYYKSQVKNAASVVAVGAVVGTGYYFLSDAVSASNWVYDKGAAALQNASSGWSDISLIRNSTGLKGIFFNNRGNLFRVFFNFDSIPNYGIPAALESELKRIGFSVESAGEAVVTLDKVANTDILTKLLTLLHEKYQAGFGIAEINYISEKLAPFAGGVN